MTGRYRARKRTHTFTCVRTHCSHILFCVAARVSLSRASLHAHAFTLRALFAICIATCVLLQTCRFFFLAIFFIHSPRHADYFSHVCRPSRNNRVGKRTCTYIVRSDARKQRAGEIYRAFASFYLLIQRTSQNAALKFSQFVCQRAGRSSSVLSLSAFSRLPSLFSLRSFFSVDASRRFLWLSHLPFC